MLLNSTVVEDDPLLLLLLLSFLVLCKVNIISTYREEEADDPLPQEIEFIKDRGIKLGGLTNEARGGEGVSHNIAVTKAM
jgi:hypothetical protein